MTNREFFTTIANMETLDNELREHAQLAIEKLDTIAEKRKGVVSKKDKEKREANEAMAKRIADKVLTSEGMTATDIAEALNETLAEGEEPVKVQKASYIARLAVKMGLANETEVKIPKKGKQKAYTKVEE